MMGGVMPSTFSNTATSTPLTSPATSAHRMWSTWNQFGKMTASSQMTIVLISTRTRPNDTKISGRSSSWTSGLTKVISRPKTALTTSHARTLSSVSDPMKNTCGTMIAVSARLIAHTSQRMSTGRTRKCRLK